ncbi:MAG: NAD(P)-dependent oxidoreductase [candidate division Zixibacteria bacterium]|nr:NAD(P)-dependent oxidoreductase [candidate division Zixibacteria bacterium]
MNILITGAASTLAREIAVALGETHQLRLMDEVPVEPPEKAEFFQGTLLEQDDVWRAVRGMHAVLHTGEVPPNLPDDPLARDQRRLDLATRGTHNLFKAGVEAGVKRFVYGSTLDIFRPYSDEVYISEMWKPLPSPDMPEMSRYLGELICREFARDFMVTVTALRLGKMVYEEQVAGQKPDLLWVDYRDACQAFRTALDRDACDQVWWTRRWTMCHICADIPNPKYLITHAGHLGYRPEHRFAAHWNADA